MEIREVTYLAVALRIVAAVIIGGLLGLERGMKNRPAGLRTYMLVCVGSCLIMLTNQYIFQVYGAGDPVRLGAQVVSGIGFLGAGTIVVTRRNQIKGLTTAAGLWTSAGIGLALGIGFYEAALVGSIAIFTVITLLQKMDNSVHRRSKQLEVYIELSNQISLGDFLRTVRSAEVEIYNVQREQGGDSDSENRAYVATLKAKKRGNHMEILTLLQDIPGVAYLEEL
ncbi:MAG: MgtC/SapB family protein [Oscillospiraceae bacterium]|nr:MgtC/SapB family protein [Oscillospiraceae bacterium]